MLREYLEKVAEPVDVVTFPDYYAVSVKYLEDALTPVLCSYRVPNRSGLLL